MSNVILSISSTSVQPQRLEGNVKSDKDGYVTIEYKEKGMVKTTSRKFSSDELAAYMTGEAGFVVALLNEPIAKAVGTLTTMKSGAKAIKTEAGTVIINSKVAGVLTSLTEVDADSKEAKAAARAAKVKVRGARASAAPSSRSSKSASGDKKPSREERRASKKAPAKSEKTSDAPKKKRAA